MVLSRVAVRRFWLREVKADVDVGGKKGMKEVEMFYSTVVTQ